MRESGYYWIRFMSDMYWEIAYFDGIWERHGRDAGYYDDDLYEIDERKIERQ